MYEWTFGPITHIVCNQVLSILYVGQNTQHCQCYLLVQTSSIVRIFDGVNYLSPNIHRNLPTCLIVLALELCRSHTTKSSVYTGILSCTKQLPKHVGFLSYKATGCFNSCFLCKDQDISEPTAGWDKVWHDLVKFLLHWDQCGQAMD